jgi:hypothetical protein
VHISFGFCDFVDALSGALGVWARRNVDVQNNSRSVEFRIAKDLDKKKRGACKALRASKHLAEETERSDFWIEHEDNPSIIIPGYQQVVNKRLKPIKSLYA